ncbi:hypothetical protein [Erythrobacter donghaensis]|jgi:hypothetical protein|uniref:hypothetical protein n=1 Tax=Erythrobacter donghaensis TaxID=267135 RepID=UPI000A81B021|nr:hypothetical protein [Erythrobacter donghaensis]
MDSSAVNAAHRIGIAVLALALYALGLPVPLIAPTEWLMPANRATLHGQCCATKSAMM